MRQTLTISLLALAAACSSSAPTTSDDDSADFGEKDSKTYERPIVMDGRFLVDSTLELSITGDSFDFTIDAANIPLKREGVAEGSGKLTERRGEFTAGDCRLTFDVSDRQVFVNQEGACADLAPEGVSFAGPYSLAPVQIATYTQVDASGKNLDGGGVISLLKLSETAMKFDMFNTGGAFEGDIEFVDGHAEFKAADDCQLAFESTSIVIDFTQTGACATFGEAGFSLAGSYRRF